MILLLLKSLEVDYYVIVGLHGCSADGTLKFRCSSSCKLSLHSIEALQTHSKVITRDCYNVCRVGQTNDTCCALLVDLAFRHLFNGFKSL